MAANLKPIPFIALIMAGGSGTRFWPASRKDYPKQYLNLVGNRSLIQQSIDRLAPLADTNHIYISSGESQAALLHQQLPEVKNLILEPAGRNTAPCLMLSVASLLHQGQDPQTVMGVFPADHFIGAPEKFIATLETAIKTAARADTLVTLGITPTHPHTGYGYIEASTTDGASEALPVRRFVEKPDLEKAKSFLASKHFYWNGGIFVWTLKAISEAFRKYLPEEWELIQIAVQNNTVDADYGRLKKQPIDTAVLEKASNVQVVPADMDWSDIGSWNALLELIQTREKSANAVLTVDPKSVRLKNVSNCLVQTTGQKQIALIGLNDLIVVETDGALLIAHRSQDQLVREMAESFEAD